MKYLLFTLEYPPFYGGIANYYKHLVSHWPEPKNIFVLNNNNGQLINHKLPFLKWLPAIWRLRQEIKKNNINYIFVGHILPLGTATLIINWLTGIKYSVILHGLDFSFATSSFKKKLLTKIILKKADKVICANNYTAELEKNFLNNFYNKKIFVVKPGIEAKEYAPNQELKSQLISKYNLSNKFILLSIGRLVKRKGFDRVIMTLPEVLKQVPNLFYIILGSGQELGNLKFQIQNLNLVNKVKIFENVDDQEKNAWLDLCHIFIMPARQIGHDFEGFGLVYLEANLAGKPVIAGNSGGISDAVIDNVNGLLVNPENIDEISQAIIKLELDEKLRNKLGQQGKLRAINKFNWQKQINEIFKIISTPNF